MIRILCWLFLAAIIIQPVLGNPRDKAKALYKEGVALKRSGKMDAALKCFHAAIQHDNALTAAYLELGQIYASMENYRLSNYYYRQLLKTDGPQGTSSEDVQVMHNLGHEYYYGGNYKAAVALWTKLLSLQPENYFAMFMLGKSYIGSGEHAKGEELCDRAVSY